MSEPVIEVKGLVKRFGDKTVVDHFDISVPKGAIYGFLGPNGSGKTTTIRMLCGLLTPDAGDGTCLGYDILRQSDSIKEHVGYMTQKFSLYSDLTIRENLDFMGRMYRIRTSGNAASGSMRHLKTLVWRTDRISSPASCRAAGSSAWRLPPVCCTIRTCCCLTSRRPASTPRHGVISGTKSAASPTPVSPCLFPPTTWTRRCNATTLPISPMARS